jgi:Tol biopolymer transport system component
MRQASVIAIACITATAGIAANARTSSPGPSVPQPGSGREVQSGEPWILYEGPAPEVGGVGIRLIRPDGTGEHWAAAAAPIGPGGDDGDGWQILPDWSPTGDRIAFVVDTWPEPEATRDLWVVGADGSNARRVYDCAAPCIVASYPAWSHDGDDLLFTSWDHDERGVDGSRLQLLDLTTDQVTTLATTSGAEYLFYPRWSPDARQVVAELDTYSSISDEATLVSTGVVVVDLATSPATMIRLTEPGDQAGYPDWHPGEDLIVYASGGDLFTMRPDGSDRVLFANDSLSLAEPSWLPDGSGVIAVRVDGDNFSTARMVVIDGASGAISPATTDGLRFGTHPRLRPGS